MFLKAKYTLHECFEYTLANDMCRFCMHMDEILEITLLPKFLVSEEFGQKSSSSDADQLDFGESSGCGSISSSEHPGRKI